MENDRVSLEDLTQGQWLELRYQMEPRNFKRLVERARNAGIDVPACVGVKNYAPKIKFSTVSETARYVRSQDIEAVKTFNRRCENWSIFVTAELRSQARMSFPHNPKRSKGATPLSESINGNVRYDKKYKVEVRSLGFSFARHGVMLHYGASSGHGGYIGSKWRDRFGNIRTTNPASFGKMGQGNRKAVHWFNPVLRKHLPTLADIAAEYCMDMSLNLAGLFLEE